MNRKAALLVLAVFVLGITVGALGMYVAGGRTIASNGKGRGPERVVEKLNSEVGLTADQQHQILAILEETKGRYNAVYESIRPQTDQIRREGRQRIRTVLSPEQLPKFEAFLQKLDEERKKRNGR